MQNPPFTFLVGAGLLASPRISSSLLMANTIWMCLLLITIFFSSLLVQTVMVPPLWATTKFFLTGYQLNVTWKVIFPLLMNSWWSLVAHWSLRGCASFLPLDGSLLVTPPMGALPIMGVYSFLFTTRISPNWTLFSGIPLLSSERLSIPLYLRIGPSLHSALGATA